METKILILLVMIFMSIVDDFYLQTSILVNLKQKEWWEKNASNKMYKHDYIVALLIHGFSWTFMVMLVPTIYTIIVGGHFYVMVFIGNVVLHAITDDLKANKKFINLAQDQFIHMLQILHIWFFTLY